MATVDARLQIIGKINDYKTPVRSVPRMREQIGQEGINACPHL